MIDLPRLLTTCRRYRSHPFYMYLQGGDRGLIQFDPICRAARLDAEFQSHSGLQQRGRVNYEINEGCHGHDPDEEDPPLARMLREQANGQGIEIDPNAISLNWVNRDGLLILGPGDGLSDYRLPNYQLPERFRDARIPLPLNFPRFPDDGQTG